MKSVPKTLSQNLIDRFSSRQIPEGKPYIEIYDLKVPTLSIRLGKKTKTFYVTVPAQIGSRKKRVRIGDGHSLSLKAARIEALDLLETITPTDQKMGQISLGEYIENTYFDGKDKRINLNRINRNYPIFQMSIDKVKPFHVKEWIEERKNSYVSRTRITKEETATRPTSKKVSISTVKREHNIIRAALAHATEREYISSNPASNIKIKGDDSILRQPIPPKVYEEYQTLIGDLPNSPLKLFLAILLYTGARPKEVYSIQLKYIDFENNKIIVPASFSKTRQTRYLHIPEKLIRFFTDFMNSKSYKNRFNIEGWLFFNPDTRKPFSGFDKAFKREVEKRRLPFYSLYHFRHTFASQCANKGIDIVTIMKLLGHNSIETTQNYLASFEQTEIAAVNEFAESIDVW